MADDAVLEILKSIQGTLAEHTAALAEIKGMATANAISMQVHGGILNAVQQDVRMVRSALNDMERTRFTAGEASVIHEDLNRLQASYTDLAVRVGVLEEQR